MNFVRISRASDNPKTAPKGRHDIGRGVSPCCFVARQQTEPGTGDTTKLCATPVGFNWYNRIVLPGVTPRPVIFHAFGVFLRLIIRFHNLREIRPVLNLECPNVADR